MRHRLRDASRKKSLKDITGLKSLRQNLLPLYRPLKRGFLRNNDSLLEGTALGLLRFLIIDCAPQVLYFLKSSEPFGGTLSSTGNSLEELTFSGIESMQSSDLKRMLNKHAFSCRRFPRLRRLVLQGLLGTEVPPEHSHGGRKVSCSLELRRERSTTFGATSVSVDVSYSYWDSLQVERPSQADGFARFEISNWCCFSGLCSESKPNGTGSLADVMSLGSIVKWSLPTIGSVLGALQTHTLGQFAQVIEIKVSGSFCCAKLVQRIRHRVLCGVTTGVMGFEIISGVSRVPQ
ncbi:hypothetical protein BT96DRAFT_1022979 [Gymnopus androsaceus JB14]|uniref:Uncharacterized protein n=1 Tax=Gymnopus androsaceus JB14 TaxID=1447944 RepID=A0A6A4H5K0_9AGAR|nr:hypothetical protein BT96DRAFT_1022979 [Gymnopus androsaceus JB14]